MSLKHSNWHLSNLIIVVFLVFGIQCFSCEVSYAQTGTISIDLYTQPGSLVFVNGSLSGRVNSDGVFQIPLSAQGNSEAVQLRIEHANYRTYESTIPVVGPSFQNPIVINLSSTRGSESSFFGFIAYTLFGFALIAVLFIAGKYYQQKQIVKPKPPSKPTRTFTDFSIVSKIAQGGVATIYEAIDKSNQRVALKVMSSYLEDEDMVNKFIGEGWAMQKIKEKFPDAPVAMVFEYGRKGNDPNGVPYIAMELVEGKTLSFYIENNVLNIDQKIKIIKQLSIALDASHRCKVLHRDLSPDNVLVKDSSEVEIRLIDFGVARHEIHWLKGTSVGAAFGKPEYMAPEQIEGKQIDFRVDYYSLGILSYALFMGKAPFTGKMMYDVFEKHLKAQVPAMPDKVPKNIQDMIYSLLQKKPAMRPDSAGKIIEYLNNT